MPRKLAAASVFLALLIVSTFIRFPLGGASFTLQVAVMLLCGLMLGGRWSALCLGGYVLIGLIGVPVFTKGGGPHYVFQYEFAYLLGFIAAASATGAARRARWFSFLKHPLFKNLAACLIGLVALYAVALPYVYLLSHLYFGTNLPTATIVNLFFLAYLPVDLLKAVGAALLAQALMKRGLLMDKPARGTHTT